MGYHSEIHLLYGAPKAQQVPELPGHAEQQPGDFVRIVLGGFNDEPTYRYFDTYAVARREAVALRRQFKRAVVQCWDTRDEIWVS